MMIQRLTKLALIGVLFMNMGSFSMQPNNNNANDEAPWKRQAKSFASFAMGAAALGAISYLASSSCEPDITASAVGSGILMGGLYCSSYYKKEGSWKPSLTAAIAWAATVASVGCIMHKTAKNAGFSTLTAIICGWLVGNKVYYAQ